MSKMTELIKIVTFKMQAAGYCFNGVQIFDHLKIMEVCDAADSIRFVAVKNQDGKWFTDPVLRERAIDEAIGKLNSGQSCDSPHCCQDTA